MPISWWPIRVVVHTYDLITLPIYTLVQQPWTLWPKLWSKRANQDDTCDLKSAWRCNDDQRHDTEQFKVDTVAQLLENSMVLNKTKPCLGHRRVMNTDVGLKHLDNQYTWLSYNLVNCKINQLARGMVKLGIKPGDKVVIMLETRYEWQLVAQGVLRFGATLCTMYSTLGRDGIVHSINDLEAKVVICNDGQVGQLQAMCTDIPLVSTLIVIGETRSPSTDRLKIMTLDLLLNDDLTPATTYRPKANDLALIMYTSGSTGHPKGVMFTQNQLVKALEAFDHRFYRHNWSQATFMAFLPLAHIFEFIIELSIMSAGGRIGYGSPLTLLNTSPGLASGCSGDVTTLNPTLIILVPLLLDRIRMAISDQVARKGAIFKHLFDFCVSYKHFWQSVGYDTPLLNKFVFGQTRALLGNSLIEAVVGAAPLSPMTQMFARSVLDVHLLQGYGTTECAAVSTCMDREDHSLGGIGGPFNGVKLKLRSWPEGGYSLEGKPNPRGELLVGAEFVAVGYYKRPDDNKESFEVDSNGTRWFITGDIAEVCSNGTFKIIDRKKDLIKLANGEFVSLGKVDAALRSCPYIENVCVLGDSMSSSTVALILPNRQKLNDVAVNLGLKCDWECLCDDPIMNQVVLRSVHECGLNCGLSRTETPVKIKLCPDLWTPSSGLVTASLKIRRRQISDFYQQDLKAMCL